MNKIILTLTTAIAFGAVSSAAMADTALELGESGNYGHPHAAASAPVQTAQQATVAAQGEAAAYPNVRSGAQLAHTQQPVRSPALAAAPAIVGTPYQAN